MKSYQNFISEASKKRCPSGKYWCFTDKKCKNIPAGFMLDRAGMLAKENGHTQDSDSESEGNGNGGNGGGE